MTFTIAVVDDDVRILDAVEMVLEAENWTVRTYTTGEAFLTDLALDCVPQCLVLDPHLKGISGADVARAIAYEETHGHFPIIAMTARPSSSVTLQLVGAGALAVLTKPFPAEELIGQIRAAIGSVDS